MRTRRLHLVLPFAASLVSLALVACSGASEQDVADSTEDAGTTGTFPGSGSTGSPGSTGAGTGSNGGSGTGTFDAGTGLPSNPGTGVDAGAGSDAGSAPADGGNVGDGAVQPIPDGGDAGDPALNCKGTIESEPNDAPATATPFTASICGTVKAKDVDYLSFVLPADAKTIKTPYKATGPVTFHVTVKGQTIDAPGPGSPVIPLYPGEKYVFDVSTTSNKPVVYELSVDTK